MSASEPKDPNEIKSSRNSLNRRNYMLTPNFSFALSRSPSMQRHAARRMEWILNSISTMWCTQHTNRIYTLECVYAYQWSGFILLLLLLLLAVLSVGLPGVEAWPNNIHINAGFRNVLVIVQRALIP